MRSCGSWLSSWAVSVRARCSMACGLKNSSKMPPATSRIPSSPLSTRPILNVLSSAGDSGGTGGLALVREVAIGPGLPSGLGMLMDRGCAAGEGAARAGPRDDRGSADHQDGGQRAQAPGKADQPDGADKERAARVAELAADLGGAHGLAEPGGRGGGGERGEPQRGGGADAGPGQQRGGQQPGQAGQQRGAPETGGGQDEAHGHAGGVGEPPG